MNQLKTYEIYEKVGHDIFKIICSLPTHNAEAMRQLADAHCAIENKKLDIFNEVMGLNEDL